MSEDTIPPSHFSSGYYAILIFSKFSSQNVPQSRIAVDCWQYPYEILKWFVNHLINVKVLISNFFQLQIEHLLWLHIQRWSKQKLKIVVFHCHLFFYRLWHVKSSIHASLDIIYGFCPDASESRLWYTHIQTIFYLVFQKRNDINYLP